MLFYIALTFVVGYVVGRGRFATLSSTFQNRGEVLVCRTIQENFLAPDFHLLNHITLRLADGTTQIDHILVSRFGVFVIETKDYQGWIFGAPKQANWTQVLYGGNFKFQNPILQNARHLRSVRELLDFLPSDSVKPVVVFAGRAEFKTDIPPGVVTLPRLVEYLRAFDQEVLSLNRIQFCVGRLETARLAISGKTDLEHLQSLRHRHGSAD
jgi:hypothetical protein